MHRQLPVLTLPVTCRDSVASTFTMTPVPRTGAGTTPHLSSMDMPGTAVSTTFSFFIRKKATHAHYATGIFSRLVPLSTTYNVRIVLVNRHDYPGAAPYSKEDRAALDAAAAEVDSDATVAQANVLSVMKANARDLYDFLTEFVAENDIPKASVERDSGGLMVGGWSFGGAWMTALLAYADSFSAGHNDLGAYIRRVILYGASRYRSPLLAT